MDKEELKVLTRIANALEAIANSKDCHIPDPVVYEIGLLTPEEFLKYKGRIPFFNGTWWLDSTDREEDTAICVDYENRTERISANVNWVYVRPVLRISNGFEYDVEEKIRIGKRSFIYLGGDLLLSISGTDKISYTELCKKRPWEWESYIFGNMKKVTSPEESVDIIDMTMPANVKYTLLDENEFETYRDIIPVIDRDWWLRSRSNPPSFVSDRTNKAEVAEFSQQKHGVRPALLISKTDLKLKPGDRVRIGKYTYTFLGDNYLLCDSTVGRTIYDRNDRIWDNCELHAWMNGKCADFLSREES